MERKQFTLEWERWEHDTYRESKQAQQPQLEPLRRDTIELKRQLASCGTQVKLRGVGSGAGASRCSAALRTWRACMQQSETKLKRRVGSAHPEMPR